MKQMLLTLALLLIAPLAHAQALYLSPYTGNGTEANPFRGHGVGQGAECKSLRPNEAQLAGYALCEGPTLPVARGVIDLTGKRAITKADRDNILAEHSLSVSATTFDGLVSELADKQNVTLKRKNGRERIYIKGHEVWSRPAPLASYLRDIPQMIAAVFKPALAWAATLVEEDWDCADDSSSPFVCDHSWVRSNGTTAQLKDNTMQSTGSGSNTVYNSSTLDSTDMLVRATVSTIARGGATDVAGGPEARHTGTGTSTYVYCVARDAATDQIEFGHVSSGSLTTDGTFNTTVANGDTVEVRAVDDQLSCRHNNVLVLGPITEATGDGNVNGAVRFSGSGTADGSTITALDNWVGSNTIPSDASFGPLRRRGL